MEYPDELKIKMDHVAEMQRQKAQAETKEQKDYYEQQAAILAPFLGTIGTCGYFAAKAKAAKDAK